MKHKSVKNLTTPLLGIPEPSRKNPLADRFNEEQESERVA